VLADAWPHPTHPAMAVRGGLLAPASAALLRGFFAARRGGSGDPGSCEGSVVGSVVGSVESSREGEGSGLKRGAAPLPLPPAITRQPSQGRSTTPSLLAELTRLAPSQREAAALRFANSDLTGQAADRLASRGRWGGFGLGGLGLGLGRGSRPPDAADAQAPGAAATAGEGEAEAVPYRERYAWGASELGGSGQGGAGSGGAALGMARGRRGATAARLPYPYSLLSEAQLAALGVGGGDDGDGNGGGDGGSLMDAGHGRGELHGDDTRAVARATAALGIVALLLVFL